MKKIILLATMFAVVLGVNAQRRMQVWEGNTYMQFFTTDVDSVTFLQFPDGVLRECTKTHDTIRVIVKDTVYVDVCGSGVATVSTSAVTHATHNSLALGGTVRFSDYDAITECGICFATHTEPTTADNVTKVGKGTGSFSITITGLTAQTTYYLRAYAVNEAGTAYGNEIVYTTPDNGGTSVGGTGTEGSLVGKFSVSAEKQVYFSKGNLQYQASTNTWRFAENQTDYIGEANKNISDTYDGWIDLFGWGTSGFDNTVNDPFAINYQPWASNSKVLNAIKVDSTQNCEMQPITGECEWVYTYLYSKNTYGYGPSDNMVDRNLTGTSANYDWGVYNAISNGGGKTAIWRTLTGDEWSYLFLMRKNAKYLWSQATINGVYGIIILPDNFSTPTSISWIPRSYNWSTNTYTLEQWSILQAIGAVFLPAAGFRLEQNMCDVQGYGYYWSSTAYYDSSVAYRMYFNDSSLDSKDAISPQYVGYHYSGYSVRLVQDVQ